MIKVTPVVCGRHFSAPCIYVLFLPTLVKRNGVNHLETHQSKHIELVSLVKIMFVTKIFS